LRSAPILAAKPSRAASCHTCRAEIHKPHPSRKSQVVRPKLQRIRDLLLFQRASQAALAEGYFLFIGTVPKTPAPPRAQPPDSSQSKSAAHSVPKTLVSGTRNEFGSRYFSFSYSALACIRMGMSGSASLHNSRKSLYAARLLAVSPCVA